MGQEQRLYAVHLRLIGKRVVDFLLLIIELFFAATNENRLKIGVFEGTLSVWPKISVTRNRPPPTILPVRKLDEWAFYIV